MATTGSITVFDVVMATVRTFYQHKQEQMRLYFARRRVFRDTVAELSMLSDRTLRDLGIARASIKQLAWETANER
ncbi:MAG: DUF1127 domain-containing protein [Planktotalea sp.]|uniref:DUF1127 domain-containing protein n=1 Tax=Planktotalea sp. TaxID=2029877 RepID=UPI003C792B78